jgi:hypothetical protein
MLLRFLGAAGTVTGSRLLLEYDDHRVLVDCGMFQGNRELRRRNWAPFPVDPTSIDAVVVTHAHLDHTGWLPRLVAEGFTGPIYATGHTAELAALVLRDAAHLQEEDAEYAIRKGYSKHSRPEPLYDTAQAEKAIADDRGRIDLRRPAPAAHRHGPARGGGRHLPVRRRGGPHPRLRGRPHRSSQRPGPSLHHRLRVRHGHRRTGRAPPRWDRTEPAQSDRARRISGPGNARPRPPRRCHIAQGARPLLPSPRPGSRPRRVLLPRRRRPDPGLARHSADRPSHMLHRARRAGCRHDPGQPHPPRTRMVRRRGARRERIRT